MRDRSPAAEAERREALPPAAPPKLVEERRQDARARRADRVAERDRAAVDVDLVPVEAELVAIGQDLRGERLVDLDQIEVVDADPPTFSIRRRTPWIGASNSHFGRDVRLRVADDARQRLRRRSAPPRSR